MEHVASNFTVRIGDQIFDNLTESEAWGHFIKHLHRGATVALYRGLRLVAELREDVHGK